MAVFVVYFRILGTAFHASLHHDRDRFRKIDSWRLRWTLPICPSAPFRPVADVVPRAQEVPSLRHSLGLKPWLAKGARGLASQSSEGELLGQDAVPRVYPYVPMAYEHRGAQAVQPSRSSPTSPAEPIRLAAQGPSRRWCPPTGGVLANGRERPTVPLGTFGGGAVVRKGGSSITSQKSEPLELGQTMRCFATLALPNMKAIEAAGPAARHQNHGARRSMSLDHGSTVGAPRPCLCAGD